MGCSVVQKPLTGLRMGASLHCPAWPFPFCETLVVVVCVGGFLHLPVFAHLIRCFNDHCDSSQLQFIGFVIQKPEPRTTWVQIRVGRQSSWGTAAGGEGGHTSLVIPADLANPRTWTVRKPGGQELAGGRE